MKMNAARSERSPLPAFKAAVLFFCGLSCLQAQAEITLPDFVSQAVANYPSVRVSDQQLQAAAAGISLARTAYLPRVDFLAQANRATRNNVFGLLLPQSTLPTISGPPNPTNSLTSVWGSAVGVLVSWEPFDFGLRQSTVDAAEASRRRSDVAVQRTKFEVAAMAADAYLTALAAEQTLRAAQAQLARSKTIDTIIGALTKAELRPGADLSRSQAEIAVAETQVVQAESAVAAARTTLHQLSGKDVRPVLGGLAELPNEVQPDAPVATNPYAREQSAAVDEVKAQAKILDRSWYPRFNVQGSSYARGTGAVADGTTLGGVSGLGPNIHNWAAGMTVTFPVFDFASLRVKKEINEHRRLEEAARYDQIVVDLDAKLRRSKEQLESARRVAALVPRQLEAARTAEQQATARYKAGLATLVEVADTERLLTQAEIDDSLARLNVWRSMLAVAAANGDLAPFLDRVK
jgi:outer membrane protein TolC